MDLGIQKKQLQKNLKKIISIITALSLFSMPFQSLMALGISYADKGGDKTKIFISETIKAPATFTGLGIKWNQNLPEGSSAELLVRLKYAENWSQWYLIEPDIDGVIEADITNPEAFLPMNATDTFQYKTILNAGYNAAFPTINNVKFTYIHADQNFSNTQNQIGNNSKARFASSINSKYVAVASGTDSSGLKIISRSQWGADEGLRVYKATNPQPQLVKTPADFAQKFANELVIRRVVDKDQSGNNLTWPQQYPEKISKIIIHHTATTKNLDNPVQAIKDIYYWHAISRGWGDIGYNYIIDPHGNIYEGRAGGDMVVGAHAGTANIGSIGVAVLGNYDTTEVPDAVIKAISTFVRAKSQQLNIDPAGNSMFRGENSANVLGHRNVAATSCPGAKLYAKLPEIRLTSKMDIGPKIINKWPNLPANRDYDFALANNIPFLQFGPDESKVIDINLKNNGPKNWGVGTYLVLSADGAAGSFFKTGDVVKSNSLNREVRAGETANFQISIKTNYVPGITNAEIAPVIDGYNKVEKYISLPLQITQPVYDYELQEIKIDRPFLKKNEVTNATVTIKNTGNITWLKSGKNKLLLGADKPRDHKNILLPKPSNRLSGLAEDQVKPGEIGHFYFQLKAPKKEGLYQEYITPVIEGLSWLSNKNSSVKIYVYQKDFAANSVDMIANRQVLPGEQKTLWFKIQNLGGVTWNKDGANKMEFIVENNKNINITDIHMVEDKVEPGQTAKIEVNIQAPTQIGVYPLQVMPKIGNNKLFKNPFYLGIMIEKQNSSNEGQIPVQPILSPQPVTNNNANTTLSSNPNIRIDLSYRGSPVVISADGPFALQNGIEDLATFQANEKVSVTFSQNNYYVQGSSGSLTVSNPPRFYSPNGSTILRVDSWERRNSWNPSVNNNQFRGVLEVRSYNNELHTINELPLEDYLKGTGEINDQDPVEKIKTILIISRSYALYYIKVAQKFPGAPFNLTDDPQTSQKYMGYSYERNQANTVKAVNDTAGMVVTYQGKIIKTPYFSADDGRTRSAQEVWGWKDTPYLTSVADPYCVGKQMSGHGVGLSGCGSLGMAKAGKSYQEIIKYYYQGVNIEKVY